MIPEGCDNQRNIPLYVPVYRWEVNHEEERHEYFRDGWADEDIDITQTRQAHIIESYEDT